jgi:hypothetical protein
MNRSEFSEMLEPELQSIKDLFAFKNISYGMDDDVFHNFRNTALRVFGTDDHQMMLKVLMTYMDKHLVAIVNKGLYDKEYESRLKDIIVYSLLAIAMGKDFERAKFERCELNAK